VKKMSEIQARSSSVVHLCEADQIPELAEDDESDYNPKNTVSFPQI
jgi:hypothetical protein